MSLPKTISITKLSKFLSEKQMTEFREWHRTIARGSGKYINFEPLEKDLRIYQSWVAGKTSIQEVRSHFNCAVGTAYTMLAHIGAYLQKNK